MNFTLCIIKPDAVQRCVTGGIISMIEESGFTIAAQRMTLLSEGQAKKFYDVHKERPFYNDLVKYMSSGRVIVLALQKDNAVQDFRDLIGSTDPRSAAENTIRNKYGISIEENAVHGSDSDSNASREISFFFPLCDMPVGL